MAAYKAGDRRAATRRLATAAAINPLGYDSLIQLGDAGYEMKDSETASASYERAIKLRPRVATAYGKLAYLNYYDRGRALAILGVGLSRSSPPRGELYYLRSRLEADSSEFVAAHRDALQALADSPRVGTYLEWLGDLSLHQKRYGEAMGYYSELSRALDKPWWPWVARLHLARVYDALGDRDSAVFEYRAAAAISLARAVTPVQQAQNYEFLGEALVRAGRKEDAVAAFRSALSHDRTNATALERLSDRRDP